MTGLEKKLGHILELQQTNYDILRVGRLRTESSDEKMMNTYVEKGYEEKTRDGLKYLSSKFSLLEQISDDLQLTVKDKRDSSIDDERRLFIESKILMEELKQNAASNSDLIAMSRSRIKVYSGNKAYNDQIKDLDKNLSVIVDALGHSKPN